MNSSLAMLGGDTIEDGGSTNSQSAIQNFHGLNIIGLNGS